MKALAFFLPVGMAALLFPACVPNHYLGYKDAVQQPPKGAGVVLEDQFRKTKATVIEPVTFFNPVEKTKWTGEHQKPVVSKIIDKDHHLTGYRIETEEIKPRVVWVKNQFSPAWQKLEVRQPYLLLAPTQKIKPNLHNPPKRLDHYVCYEVTGEPRDVRVALKDQFNKYDYMPTGKPVLLCNPVKKTHHNKETPVLNPKWHLVGYQLDKKLTEIIPVTGNNQFGEEAMRLQELELILVPSSKDTTGRHE